MVYLVGTLGFIGGFVVGQMLLAYMLRNVSREKLLKDKSLRWTYGTLNWLFAALGAVSMVMLYRQYFH